MDTAHEKHHSEGKSDAHPVMDVVPPKSSDAPKEPPKDDGPKTPPTAVVESMPHNSGKPAVHKPDSQKTPGVGLAIVATVIIVLGLALLFVYAYLRSNNLSSL